MSKKKAKAILVSHAEIKYVLDQIAPAIKALPPTRSLVVVCALLAGAANTCHAFDTREDTFVDLARRMFVMSSKHRRNRNETNGDLS